MRLTRRRRALALIAGTFVFAMSAVNAAAFEPKADPAPDPNKDNVLVAEPANTGATLSRGASSVTVSRTAGLTRQMLSVSWTGMTPSPSLGPTYSVVIMQCRGANPAREDCWMGSIDANGNALGSNAQGSVRPTLYPQTETAQWWTSPPSSSGQQMRIPFRKADGTPNAILNANGFWTVLPLATTVEPIDDVTPGTKNFRRGATRPDGTGEMQTWVNTKLENQSLGCSETSPCSLVVVPVAERPCKPDVTGGGLTFCNNQIGKPPSENWQLLANWYDRYVFKLNFAPAATACVGRDDSAVMLGSELVAEAMRRWVPARCQQSSPAGLDYTRTWEPDSLRQLGMSDPIAPSGYAADAAVVSEPAAADNSVATKRKAAYAPIAVSGFAIGFRMEKIDGSPIPDVKLNQRLVAKLLTQSYPGRYAPGTGFPVNPNTSGNPQRLLSDPEFQQLNPGAAQWAGGTDPLGTQLAIPVFKTDVMLALTRWLWADPSARSFLQGRPDQWGMTVNKTYRNWQLPRDDYNLNDGWTLGTDQQIWSGFAPQALWAQTTGSWAQGADVLMTAWPLSQYPNLPTEPGLPVQPKRNEVLLSGSRNLLAVSTTSELEKAGIAAVSLRNAQGEFVQPSYESMTYALDGATVDQSSGVWKINYSSMDKRGYPGTMISYAAVPTSTLKGTEAKDYADTLRWATTVGQEYGQESGNLPEGYLTLTDTMRQQAAKVADAVENQIGKPVIPPDGQDPVDDDEDDTPDDPPTTNNPDDPGQTTAPPQNNGDGNGNGNGTGSNDDNGNQPGSTPTSPGATPSVGTPSKNPPQASGSTKPVSATTQGESLGWLAWGIPALLVAGLAAGVASPGIRLIAQPGHPVRRGVVAGGSYIASLLRRGRRRG